MNKEEKLEFLQNLRRRFPMKNPQQVNVKQEEIIVFLVGDRGISNINNRLNGRNYQDPLEDTHVRTEFGHGLPIMPTIPKCFCDGKKTENKYKVDKK